MHGGKGSGAPLRNQNAVTSGDYTARARAHRFFMSWLYWNFDGDGRRGLVLTTRLEVEALLKQLRAFGMDGVADDIAAEAGL
jgi:hypothetical protein